jgi:hypothetical protein
LFRFRDNTLFKKTGVAGPDAGAGLAYSVSFVILKDRLLASTLVLLRSAS